MARAGGSPLISVFGRHRGSEVKRASLILATATLVALGARAGGIDGTTAADVPAIQQLLVETILAQRPAWHGYSTDTFCIHLGRLEWKDGLLVPPEGPSDVFLNGIATHGMTVLPARGCQMVSLGIDTPGVVTRSDGRPAFFITVAEVVRPQPGMAEVHAGFICGAMCASSVTYVLERQGLRWAIIGTKDRIIS
jgi:hypothetical protein